MPSTFGSFRSRKTTRGPLLTSRPRYFPRAKRKSSASSPSVTEVIEFARWFLRSARNVSSRSCGLSSTSRISTSFIDQLRFLNFDLRHRQCEKEHRPFSRLPFRPYPPAVALDDALHDRQPHAAAFDLAIRMQPLKHSEDFFGVPHVEADPMIPNPIQVVISGRTSAKLDVDGRLWLGVLHCVSNEIEQNLTDRTPIGARNRCLSIGEFDGPVGIPAPFFGDDLARYFPEVDLHPTERLPA